MGRLNETGAYGYGTIELIIIHRWSIYRYIVMSFDLNKHKLSEKDE